MSMLNCRFHPWQYSFFMPHFFHLHLPLRSTGPNYKSWDIWPRIFPQQDLFLLCCQSTGVYLRLNSCRLKWSSPPTSRSHRLTPCWMGALLLLHHCLPTVGVSPVPAESLEGSINASSVILHRRTAHFLASTVLLVLVNRRKAWSSRDLFLFSFHFSVWTPVPRNMHLQCE